MEKTSRETVTALVKALLPDHHVGNAYGMGFDGIHVYSFASGWNYYFDNTFGGDDGESSFLRVYSDNATTGAIDDRSDLPGAPLMSAPAQELAVWIAKVVHTHHAV